MTLQCCQFHCHSPKFYWVNREIHYQLTHPLGVFWYILLVQLFTLIWKEANNKKSIWICKWVKPLVRRLGKNPFCHGRKSSGEFFLHTVQKPDKSCFNLIWKDKWMIDFLFFDFEHEYGWLLPRISTWLCSLVLICFNYVKINTGEPDLECVHTLAAMTFLFSFFLLFCSVLASQTGKDGKFKPCYSGNFSVSVQ